jgi:hypothetical protein
MGNLLPYSKKKGHALRGEELDPKDGQYGDILCLCPSRMEASLWRSDARRPSWRLEGLEKQECG